VSSTLFVDQASKVFFSGFLSHAFPHPVSSDPCLDQRGRDGTVLHQ
jgi:hypothetical protein